MSALVVLFVAFFAILMRVALSILSSLTRVVSKLENLSTSLHSLDQTHSQSTTSRHLTRRAGLTQPTIAFAIKSSSSTALRQVAVQNTLNQPDSCNGSRKPS